MYDASKFKIRPLVDVDRLDDVYIILLDDIATTL